MRRKYTISIVEGTQSPSAGYPLGDAAAAKAGGWGRVVTREDLPEFAANHIRKFTQGRDEPTQVIVTPADMAVSALPRFILSSFEIPIELPDEPITPNEVASESWGGTFKVEGGKFWVEFRWDVNAKGDFYDGDGEGDTLEEALRNAIKNAGDVEDED